MFKGVTQKVVLAMILLMMVSVASQLFYQRFVYQPYQDQVVDSILESRFRQIHESINTTQQGIRTMMYEYAAWSRLSNMVEADDVAVVDLFMDMNSSMLENDIDGMVGLSNNKTVVISIQNSETIGFGQRINQSLIELFRSSDVFIRPEQVAENGNEYLSKTLYTDSSVGPIVIVAASLVRSDGYGPSAGTLILWRKLGQRWLSDMRGLVSQSLTSHTTSSSSEIEQNIRQRFSFQQLADGVMMNDKLIVSLDNSITTEPLLYLVRPAPKLVTQEEPPYLLWSLVTMLLMMVMVFLSLKMRLLNPLNNLVDHLKRSSQNDGELASPLDEGQFQDQWLQLAQAYNAQAKRITEHQHSLIELNEQLTGMSYQDPLIGIANRRRLDEYLKVGWEEGQPNQPWFTIIIADVDFFKLYNDRYGHLKGDEVLRQVGQTLHGQVYQDRDLVARYGGEEFAIVLADSDPVATEKVMQRLCKAVRRLDIAHTQSPEYKNVTISMGACCLHQSGNASLEEVIEQADQALYQAKQNGRNGWSVNQISGKQ